MRVTIQVSLVVMVMAAVPVPSDGHNALDSAMGNSECPSPYSKILDACFYIHKYVPMLTWTQARTFCQQSGGDLAEPPYFGAVVAYLFNSGIERMIFDLKEYGLWLGGMTANDTESTMKWVSGRPVADYGIKTEPEVLDTQNATTTASPFDPEPKCLALNLHFERPAALMPDDCNKPMHYICQLSQ